MSGSPRVTSVFSGSETVVRARMPATTSSSLVPVSRFSSRATWAITGRLSSSCEMARARSAGSVCDLVRSADTEGVVTTMVAAATYSRGSSQISSRPTTAPAASGNASDHMRRRATASGSKTGSSFVVTVLPSPSAKPLPEHLRACAGPGRPPIANPARRVPANTSKRSRRRAIQPRDVCADRDRSVGSPARSGSLSEMAALPDQSTERVSRAFSVARSSSFWNVPPKPNDGQEGPRVAAARRCCGVPSSRGPR